MKTLLAGPWIGEFGWELFEWQSFIRHRSQFYDKVIVSSRPGHEILYQDFADEFIPYKSEERDCCGWTNYTTPTNISQFSNVKCTHWLRPCRYLQGRQRFIPYGKYDEKNSFDIVFAARDITVSSNYKKPAKQKQQRNCFGQTEWKKIADFLLEKNLKICSIGLSTSTQWINGTVNKQNISLEQLSTILKSSKLCIGPSSGMMHFASLCECPHLVWTSSKNIEKYKNKWNPFKTIVKFIINEEWNPDVYSIIDKLNNILKNYIKRT